MVRNPGRRSALADAGIAVLAREGSRGLTHRAVDTEAGVPAGTTSNYFRTRSALVEALVARIGERLAPAPERLAELGSREPGRRLFAEHLRYIVERLDTDRSVTLALLELRLESARRPEITDVLGRWQAEAFAADVAYNAAAGLPGGPSEIALFHYAIDGLMLDRLTTPIDPHTSTDEVIAALVEAVFGPERGEPVDSTGPR
ncbi:TetR/AcrR family transcriptional regulator [Herbiconiux sp. UC225_62]|uniref:TetR/AcrR family transcriptional regulator n=1 Tax=Herbiconiux sp. UC225_62 TaxID=3350168 RepID=UPI0036D3CBCF